MPMQPQAYPPIRPAIGSEKIPSPIINYTDFLRNFEDQEYADLSDTHGIQTLIDGASVIRTEPVLPRISQRTIESPREMKKGSDNPSPPNPILDSMRLCGENLQGKRSAPKTKGKTRQTRNRKRKTIQRPQTSILKENWIPAWRSENYSTNSLGNIA